MLNAEQFRPAVEQFAPAATDEPVAERRTPTGSTPSTGQDSARSTTSRSREAGPRHGLSRVAQLPGPARYHRRQQRASASAWVSTSTSGSPAIGSICASTSEALAPKTTSRPSVCSPTPRRWSDPADRRIRARRRVSTIGPAGLDLGRQSGRHPQSGRGEGRDVSRHRQQRRPSTGCRGSRGSGPTSTLASTSPTASGRTSRRARCTGSRRPAEAVTRPSTIRTNLARCSRPT